MTKSPKSREPGHAFREAAQTIRDVDCGCLGLLYLADLAREAAREHWWKRQEITEAEVGEVLAMICQRRGVSRPVARK